MKKNNSFSKKTITSILISSISLFIIVGYYFFAFADDDAFSNKLSIRNSVITSVIDGEEPFDSDNSAGNDSSNQNNIVRTFDKVIYSISYELYQKSVSNSEPQNQTNDENNQVGDVTPDSRSIIVDVILPSNIDGTVYSNGQPYSLISVFNNYKYAEFEIEGSIGQNSFDFSLANIYGSNGETFSPVIVLRESTDEESKSISGLTEEQRSQSLDTILSLLGSNPSCDYGNGCNISISGKERYTIKLFKGTHEVNGKDTDMAIGFMIGLEDSNEKHIKGVLYPTSVNFDINISNNIANDILYNGENDKYMIKPYNQNNSDYDIYLDDNHTNEMPDTYDGSTYNGNVSATYNNNNNNNNNLSISVSNINFNDQMTVIGNISYYYLSTNSFIIKSSRKSFSENTEDITIDFKAMQSENIIDTIQDVDKLGKFVGPYESRISIYPEYDKEHKKDDGLAILNFGEYFYFKEDIQYSVNNVGSSLKNLNNFIKIDNDAIKLVLYDNQVENQIIPQENAVNNTTSKVGYYYGKWTTEFIKMKDNAPSSCPNLELLGKEELMNLYGGPCIEFKENVSYSEFFDDSKEYGPMAMNILFTPSTDNGILVNSVWTVWHKAKIIDDTNLERSVRQISNSSTALFNNNDNVDELYYLSSNIDKNDIESMMNPNNYTKTNYDFVNRTIINNHSTICNDSLNCAITGNSILVSAIRVDKPSIETYRTNMTSRQTTEFYYYPIEWRIKGSAHKDTLISSVRFNNAYVKVSFPKYLQKIEYGAIDNSIGITNEENLTEIIDGEEYNTYIYTIDMKNRGNVDIDLPIYTNIYLNTPNNYQPKVYAEIDYDVVNGNSISNSVSPISSRRTLNQEVTLHNQVDVNTQGTTTPTYIEKNGTFTYKMEAYNNSVSDYIYKNSSLIYVLPYKGDSSYSDLSSKFVSNGYKVKIPNLPSGYKAYYTNGPSNTIISEEIMINSTKTHEWIEWENPSIEKDNITAIKIEKNSDFVREEFFGGSDGITAQVTPIGSGVGDVYYNAFYLIADRPSNYVCVPQDENDPSCDNVRDTKIFYSSNRSSTSVYNREISGFVWEDYDYSGLYEENEKKLENIPISICKVSEESKQEENYNEIDPNTYVKTTDECIKETITDVTGSFIVNGLVEGDYYVKYTFDNQKYTVTDFQKTSEGHSASINSKSFQLPGTNIAVSHVISFNNKDRVMKKEYINLGLKIKKQFAVDINKYITKTELTVDGVTTTENYKNASKVSLNVKNTKDAHVRVTYSFVIENVKYFPGYVGLITDVMPNGMTFNPNIKENKDWIQMGNVLYYNGLSKVLLLPNEKNYFNLVLDLDIKKGGYYINFVSTDDLILMGDEVPNYDFIIDNSQNSGNNETENNEEGNIGD